MKWNRDTENADVVDRRGEGSPRSGGLGGSGLKLGGGGIAAIIISLIVARATGVDISGLFGGGNSAPTTSPGTPAPPRTGPDQEAETVAFIKDTMKDIQDTFDAKFKASGKVYQRAKLNIFDNPINTACGKALSEIGPFYCPGDNQAYVDLSFFHELDRRFQAPGRFAQAYVLAHELGHHLQNIMGIEKQAARLGHDEKSKNAASVRQELQADCFAGVWGNSSQARGKMESGDIESAITAATAIGDDRLQKQAGIPVNAETFTHGTSAQRVKWFRVGFSTGSFEQCDTFAVGEP